MSLFNKEEYTEALNKGEAEIFHTFVMKCTFVAKCGRPDSLTGISYLSTKVLNPCKEDMTKLTKIVSYLQNSIDICLTLEAGDIRKFAWYKDSSFGTHGGVKSHTGGIMTLEKGSILADSTKQKLNRRSLTEAELMAVDDKISKKIWIKCFLEHQGFKPIPNILHQDNQSTIKLQENGKESSGKRTRL